MIAINAALWGTFGTIQSYEGLFILGENIVLAAPLILSITNLYYEVREVQIGFGLCLFAVLLVNFISLGMCIPKVTSIDNRSFRNFRETCRDYYLTIIVLITASVLQTLYLLISTIVVYIVRPAIDRESPLAKMTFVWAPAATPYIVAILCTIFLERMNSFAEFQWVTEEGWTSFGFAQIFAITTSIAPLIEVIKYMFRKQEGLSNRSPILYFLLATNFHLRKKLA
jgi:hypothetical protein